MPWKDQLYFLFKQARGILASVDRMAMMPVVYVSNDASSVCNTNGSTVPVWSGLNIGRPESELRKIWTVTGRARPDLDLFAQEGAQGTKAG